MYTSFTLISYYIRTRELHVMPFTAADSNANKTRFCRIERYASENERDAFVFNPRSLRQCDEQLRRDDSRDDRKK